MNIVYAGGAGSHSFRKCTINSLVSYKLIDTNQYTINKTLSINGLHDNVNYINMFPEYFKGLGTGGNFELLQKLILDNEQNVLSILNKKDINLIVAGLSGGFGTGFTRALLSIAKKHNILLVFIVLKPFDFEGTTKQNIANQLISEINTCKFPILVIENQKLLTKIDRSQTVKDAFLQVDDSINLIIENVQNSIYSKTKTINFKGIKEFTNSDVPLFFNDISTNIDKLDKLLSDFCKILVVDKSQEIIDRLKCSPEMVYQIDPFIFEEIIYSLYKSLGFKTELTKKSHDNGADILVWSAAPVIGADFLTIIQAKRYAVNKKVGSSEIRDLYGAKYLYNAHRAQCITTYGFSSEAIKTSQKMDIDLFLFNDLISKLKKN